MKHLINIKFYFCSKGYSNEFDATFIDSNNEKQSSTSAYDILIEKVFYTSNTPAAIVGDVKVVLIYDNKTIIDTSNVIIVVEPGDPDPTKLILSLEITIGPFTQYKIEIASLYIFMNL